MNRLYSREGFTDAGVQFPDCAWMTGDSESRPPFGFLRASKVFWSPRQTEKFDIGQLVFSNLISAVTLSFTGVYMSNPL
jgi:hypothetical protein